ncbi:MAG: 50S ribosomal protein L22 [Candidatus Omnitrophica bacterium]|nr:50S ribosomal protein L22 [Candidatus Omnitrophota bacterium]
MVARAYIKYVRISPFKVRAVIRLIKGLPVTKAFFILKALPKKGAFLLDKALKSAVSNAKNKNYNEDELYISKILANPGPMYKRYKAATFGRANLIRRRTSHILIELDIIKKIVKS